MKYNYLVASLPSLSLETAPPFTVKEFVFHAQGVLDAADHRDLQAVLDGRAGVSAPARRWHDLDTQLRNAVARYRAAQWGVDARTLQRPHAGFDVFLEKSAADALARPHPLERELALDRCRWYLLDQLAREDAFGLAAVLAYAVKLQLAERWSAIKDEPGQQALNRLISENLEREGYLTEFEVEVV
jgi:hypothetical protein